MVKKTKSKLKSVPLIFARNTTQVNSSMANILAYCSIAIIVMAFLSFIGFFEFGRVYTYILFIAGLIVCLMPKLLIRFLPDNFIKYYMMISVAVSIGIIGADKNIGVYITYALVPILSCLYFEPPFVLKASAFSYIVMVISVYAVSANMPELLYQGRSRMQMFLAYVTGFTIEYTIVTIMLYSLVKRAKRRLVLDVNNAERAQKDAEKGSQIFNVLCVDYTAAYYCDLMNDTIEPIKQKSYSHSAHAKTNMTDPTCYSEWIQYSANHIVAKEMAAEFLEVFDTKNLIKRL